MESHFDQGGQYAPELSSLKPMQGGQHVQECQKNQPTFVLCFYYVLDDVNMLPYNHFAYIEQVLRYFSS